MTENRAREGEIVFTAGGLTVHVDMEWARFCSADYVAAEVVRETTS